MDKTFCVICKIFHAPNEGCPVYVPMLTAVPQCPSCAALRARIEELDELRKQSNCPVKYYHHGGFVSAVYGTSSIAYVEGLRARCGDVEGIRRVIYDNALANIDNIARAVSSWLKEGK